MKNTVAVNCRQSRGHYEMKTKMVVAAALLSMVGCSPHVPTDQEIQAHNSTETSSQICYDTLRNSEMADVRIISSLPVTERGQLATIYLMQKNTVDLVAAATGHNPDPCKRTNLFDEQIAETKEKNKTASNLGGKVLGSVPWIVGGLTVNALADKAGETAVNNYQVSDNARVNVDSQNQGNGNSVGNDLNLSGNNQPCNDCDTTTTEQLEPENPEGPEPEGGPDVELELCKAEPPAGHNSSGDPLFSPNCSCISHFINGDC